ncbi:NAD(P)H-binding protein [Streptomyces litmocidini]|uniref:NAD(P)H-binding protein n=1 Tax=Streptomyces litmocidini TaxID=67318 RepID=UPI0036F87640
MGDVTAIRTSRCHVPDNGPYGPRSQEHPKTPTTQIRCSLRRDASQSISDERRDSVRWASIDVLDPPSITAVLPGLDVLISAFQPGNAARDIADTVRRSIADPTVYASAARALLKALESHPRTRLIVIGGAGSLELEPGVVRAVLDQVGLPREYAAAVRGHREALNVLRTSNRLWTYFSPAEDISPGERRSLPDRG